MTEAHQAPTAVDLFCGAGGLSHGLRLAGFKILSAVDVDSDACRSYELNHPGVPVHEDDIRKVDGKNLVKPGGSPLTLLAGCPPCQGFTRLNESSGRHDPRNSLVIEYARLVEELKPTCIFFENVPGLLRGGSSFFSKLQAVLSDLGYLSDPKVVQLADYGVPQRRRRLIVLAGKGFEIPLPQPTHARKPGKKSALQPWRTVRETLRGDQRLGRAHSFGVMRKRQQDPGPQWHVARTLGDALIEQLRQTPRSGGSREDLPDDFVQLQCHAGFNGFHDVYGRLDWDKPSVAITSGCTNLSKGRFGHPENLRALTPREAALLQGFPADYQFKASGMESVCRQIGNALPPPFAQIVGQCVIDHLRKLKKLV